MLIPTTWREDEDLDIAKALSSQEGSLGTVEIVLLPTPEIQTCQKTNILYLAVYQWLESLSAPPLQPQEVEKLASQSPGRWSTYRPMVLLPAGSFRSEKWTSVLSTTTEQQRAGLWESLLTAVSRKDGAPQLTHLAVNSGIPLFQGSSEEENSLRSPSGLVILYGDFGPVGESGQPGLKPSEEDFKSAFWVSTKQNGIYQTWAPRYTMFSRGNIKEKTRILSFGDRKNSGIGSKDKCAVMTGKTAVDLYAGIGYFVFSYASISLRVVCWEINPWSVEGLRRGARQNGWKIKVIRLDDLEKSEKDLIEDDDNIVVFEESNERASLRLLELSRSGDNIRAQIAHNVVHVNCGFLPTSEPTWQMALQIVSKIHGGWLHLHENVAFKDIERRRDDVQTRLRQFASEDDTRVEVTHAELVKTFAPGVWHCVFDASIAPIAH